MTTKACIDGRLCAEGDATISVFDRGFLYGDSAFEVIRTYGGVPFRLRAHMERLFRSCDRLMIEVPVSTEMLEAEVARTLEAAGNAESYIRVVVTRGTGPLTYDPTSARDPSRVVIVAELNPPPPIVYEQGIAVALVRVSRPSDDERAAGVKASNYLGSLLALHEARCRGGEEAILLGREGQVLEGASSNVFVVRAGALRTPPLSTGILAGITRAFVCELAGTLGIDFVEAALSPDSLHAADEVFVTSTIREIVPVVTVDDRPVGDGKPGAVTRRLMGALRAARGAG